MRIEHHPKLNIWVREDGCVYLPQNYRFPAHWTFGSKNSRGYMKVRIDGKFYLVHRLIAETFIGEIPPDCEIDHLNRVRDDNRIENIRIVTRSENHRNTFAHDRVEAQGRTHWYEDEKQYKNEKDARYSQGHRRVRFADGARHWVPYEEAKALLAIPLRQRIFNK